MNLESLIDLQEELSVKKNGNLDNDSLLDFQMLLIDRFLGDIVT